MSSPSRFGASEHSRHPQADTAAGPHEDQPTPGATRLAKPARKPALDPVGASHYTAIPANPIPRDPLNRLHPSPSGKGPHITRFMQDPG
jgi:hypothetical protein